MIRNKVLNHHICRRFSNGSSRIEVQHDSFFTSTARKRQPSPIRELAPLLEDKSMISLAGGLPNPSTFPFKSFSFQVPSKSGILNNIENDFETLSFSQDEMNLALQYGPSKGIPPLCNWLKVFHNEVHCVPYNEWDLCLSTGSQDLITRTFDTLLEDGDTILIEAPTYSGTLAYLKARNINIISVEMDENGIIPQPLDDLLSTMQASNRALPKLLYVIPIGQNPSGSSYSKQRKQQIYELVCKYNLLLFEDDAYYFLDFEHLNTNITKRNISFQSMDVEKRVIRSDSFSKILSSGLRLGYVTGPAAIVRNIELSLQSTCLHTCALSQMTLYKLLTYWEQSVLEKHLNNVCNFYYQRRNMFQNVLEKYLQNKCEWNVPKGGMFYWINVLKTNDTQILIKEKAKDAKVLLLPGNVFYVDQRSQQCSYVRASFSVATQNEMELAMKRFAKIIDDI
eukprot:71486_1